jgi:hypothetical protein
MPLLPSLHASEFIDVIPPMCRSRSDDENRDIGEKQDDIDIDLSRDEVAWLKNCLPIIIQPQVDIDNGYSLVGAFVEFKYGEMETEERFPGRCTVRLIYEVRRSLMARINFIVDYSSFATTIDFSES